MPDANPTMSYTAMEGILKYLSDIMKMFAKGSHASGAEVFWGGPAQRADAYCQFFHSVTGVATPSLFRSM
jgi:hypothetical protein